MIALVVIRTIVCTLMFALDTLSIGTTLQSNWFVPDPAGMSVRDRGTPDTRRGVLLCSIGGAAVDHLFAKVVALLLSTTTAWAETEPRCRAVAGSKLTTLPAILIVTMSLEAEVGSPLNQNPFVLG